MTRRRFEPGERIRLNRYIAACDITSRRKAEALIEAGRIAVNGEVVRELAVTVEPGVDTVTLDGAAVAPADALRYYILNKPVGYITTRSDPRGRATVLELLGPETDGVFPVGRLDRDTAGVLLFTDDCEFAYRMTHPSHTIDKVYRAVVRGEVGDEAAAAVAQGIELDDGLTSPAELRIVHADARQSEVVLTIHEGRKRQVRRMMDALGHRVLELERVSFGGLTAKGLKRGEYRPLTTAEIAALDKDTHNGGTHSDETV